MNGHESDQTMPDAKKCPQCGAALPTGALNGLCPVCLLKQGATSETATQPESAPFQPPSVAEVAGMFPQLEVLAFIGKGGMGAVYKARQPALDRFVALKILPPLTAPGTEFAERFNREARALAKLSHPNIVAIHEFGQVGGLPFFVMEFVDGLNLRQLEQAGKLIPREALQIIPQICEALQFAHDEGIVHRDIKPENILLDKKGRVKIADFGIAKIMGGEEPDVAITETKNAIGTPHYMAPEQVEKPQTVDHRADIFSLGVVFYEMLTGELPLGKFAPPSHKVEVDVRLDEVVLRALEKEPERRYQHVSQVKTAVDTIASTAPSAPPPGGEALARDILARGCELNIGSCLRRGWALVRGDFWPIAGISALITVLWAVANSSGAVFSSAHGQTSAAGSLVSLLVNGPLLGGLYLFFLKRIRREITTVETAFSGFSNRFLHLFLGYFVSCVLIVLGFICCILPGIYLAVAWMFTLPLVIDKGLDFWSAMELSRRIVSLHWWKFLCFGIILLLLKLAGIMVCLVGVFIAAPVVTASLMYAYEDLFGTAGRTTNQAPAGFGPSGTEVRPGIAVPPGSGSKRNTADARGGSSDETQGTQATGALPKTTPRFSRTAIAGACLGMLSAVMFLFAGIISRVAATPILPDGDILPDEPATFVPLIMMVAGTFFAFGFAILSLIAVSQVRRGAGYELKSRLKTFLMIQFPVALVILLVIRAFFLQPFTAATNAAAPKIPRGSHFLVWKLTGNFTPGDVIAYRHDDQVNVGRIVPGETGPVSVSRNGEADAVVPRDAILGKVISVYWRASNGAESTPNFYIGQTWFPKGDSIEITSVERSIDRMAVKGHYHLVSADEASLTLNISTKGDSSPPGYPAQPEDPTQSLRISKGQGDFELSRSHLVPGLPHVSMYANGHSFAGVYFGTKDEALAESKLDLGNPEASAEDSGQTVAGLPPVVVGTQPVSGARDVEPGITEIHVRFSKEMTDGSWSWSPAWQDSTPEIIDEQKYDTDHRTFVIKARLEPGRTYAFWLNSDKFHEFMDLSRRPAVPYLLIFSTKQN